MADAQDSTPKQPKWKRNRSGKFVAKPGARVEKKCVVCGTPFTTWANRLSPIKTCSRTCMGKMMQNRETRACKQCGASFEFRLGTRTLGAGQFCSRECRNKAKVEKYEARGTPERYKNEAHLKADKEWKAAVRKRDNYTCRRCGKRDRQIHAHHINPRSQRPDLIRVIENGACCCASCHAWIHGNPIEATKLGLLGGETYESAQKKGRLGRDTK